ncbi:MAG: 3,4-dihydroxy-2-butanone-4-phosphate synthase [Thermoplasmata archaeon]
MLDTVEEAVGRLKKGGFVMIYDSDGREEEVDLVTPSQKITPRKVRRLRQDAGGLICVTIPQDTWSKLTLPYLQDIYTHSSDRFEILRYMEADDIPYDEKSTFSLSVNHRDTFTGITDLDRSLTIKRMAVLGERIKDMKQGEASVEFGKEFRTPGHVFLLNASEGLLDERMGHTELATYILSLTSLYPSMTICEMLSDGGGSMSEEEASIYGEENDIPLIEGRDLVSVWEENNG